jgi:hypothetical protein
MVWKELGYSAPPNENHRTAITCMLFSFLLATTIVMLLNIHLTLLLTDIKEIAIIYFLKIVS